MSKLLYVNLSRLRKDKSFWIALSMMILLGVISCVNQYENLYRYKEPVTLDSFFFSSVVMIGVVIAAFSSMFIGTEYSDGTIRNKVVIGQTRSNIYFSNFLICVIVGILSNLCYIIVVCVIGIPLFGFLQSSILMIVMMLLDSLLLIIVYSAIFNLVSMLISNKAHATITSLIGIMVAMVGAVILLGMLQEPETLNDVSFIIDGQQSFNTLPNPRYLTGVKRVVIQTLEDILPTGQGLQISGIFAPNPGMMAVYSVILIILTNVIGVFSFSRKDLK